MPAGGVHAYLHGVGVEIMASSDNVLRAGLTGKHVDIPELLANVDYVAAPPIRIAPETFHGATRMFYAPVDDFELSVTTLDRTDAARTPCPGAGPGSCCASRVRWWCPPRTARAGPGAAGRRAFVPAEDGPLSGRGAGDRGAGRRALTGGQRAPLTPTSRRNPWGSPTAIPHALGLEPDGRTMAEAWFGAYPTAPSVVEVAGGRHDAHRADRADPAATLGADVVAQFGPRLPFLVKLIAADSPLSLQLHPAAGARRGGVRARRRPSACRTTPRRAACRTRTGAPSCCTR